MKSRHLNSDSEAVSSHRKALLEKENEALEVKMQLQFAEKKIGTCEGHIKQLRARIQKLEEELASSAKVMNKT